jgi:hypothetical protein
MYYENLYNVPSLVTLLTNHPTLIPLIYQNPNIINLLAHSLYMIEKMDSTPALISEYITYSTGKNPTYPNVFTNNNYLYSMNSLYYDNLTPNRQLWKYVNTAYLGYGNTLTATFTIPPLNYTFTLMDQLVRIPYNEDTFYRALYQNVAASGLKNDYLIHLLGFMNKNYSNASFLTSISYNPHLLTFLSKNPAFIYQLEHDYDKVELFIYNGAIALCLTDLYQLFYNTIPSSLYNPNLEKPYTMYQIISNSSSMKSILLQKYNNLIYYTSVQSNPTLIQFILYCIDNVPLFISQMASNPNIILFLSNNIRMVQYLIENPGSISIFTTNPNILDVKYNIIQIVISTVLEGLCDSYTRTLLTTPNNTLLNLLNCQYNNNIVAASQRGSLAPSVPQNDAYMVNLYYDPIMKSPYISRLIEYATTQYEIYHNNLIYSMSDYPNIINDIINLNPNVIPFFYHNPEILSYLLVSVEVTTSTQTPLYRFLKIPILTQPQKDISLYIHNDPNYIDFKSRLNVGIYVPTELLYMNNQTIVNSNPSFYEFLNQNYNDAIYVLQLFQFTNYIISIFIENPQSLFYNIVYQNPNIINFLAYYNDFTNYLNNNPDKIPIFINIPNIEDVMLNIYDTINAYNNQSTSSLLSTYFTTFLGDNYNVISYELNALLQEYPLLNVLFNSNNRYNNRVYDSMINTILFSNLYTKSAYNYPYIMDVSLKNVGLIPYLSNNSYGDDSFILYIMENVNQQIQELNKLVNHMEYVNEMNEITQQKYHNSIYQKVFFYNTIYGSISRFITNASIYTALHTNMNILLFLYNNPRLIEFYFGDGQIDILATNARFQYLFNQCASPTTNITTIFQTDPILQYYLNSGLPPGGVGSGVTINPDNPGLIPLLNSNPTLNTMVSQNYIFNLYFIELNNSPTLVNLLASHPSLLTAIYMNPNILNFLYENPALTIFLYNAKVCNRDYVDLLTTNPSINLIYMDLVSMYERTSLQPYLNSTLLTPPLQMKLFLDEVPILQQLIEQPYNGNMYYNSILRTLSMITLIQNYPNILNYIQLNTNIVNFMSQNPKMIDFYKFYYGDNISNLIFFYQLTQNVNIESMSSYGIIDTTTVQNASNPMIDLYKFYYMKLPQYLNPNPNILGFTNGFGSNANVNLLLQKNGTLQTFINQNYNYNIYKTFLLFNPIMVQALLLYPEILFYFVYKNPNMLSFLFFNTRLCQAFISNPSFVPFFITLTFCQNPLFNLYDVIYQYDISHPTSIHLSDYFEKEMFLDLIGNIGPSSLLVG